MQFLGIALTVTTPPANDSSTKAADTAFVAGQASSAAPEMDGTASSGSSLSYARADHVHPTDTTRASAAAANFAFCAGLAF